MTFHRAQMRIPFRPAWMLVAAIFSDALVIAVGTLFAGLTIYNLGRFWGAWS